VVVSVEVRVAAENGGGSFGANRNRAAALVASKVIASSVRMGIKQLVEGWAIEIRVGGAGVAQMSGADYIDVLTVRLGRKVA
jgi:hypothetical protein